MKKGATTLTSRQRVHRPPRHWLPISKAVAAHLVGWEGGVHLHCFVQVEVNVVALEKKQIVTWPLCLVESHTLDATARREHSLFTSLTFCKVIGSCSLRLNERYICIHSSVFNLLVICYDQLALRCFPPHPTKWVKFPKVSIANTRLWATIYYLYSWIVLIQPKCFRTVIKRANLFVLDNST